jgi:hypothetical protein
MGTGAGPPTGIRRAGAQTPEGTHPPRLRCLRGRVDDLRASAGDSLGRARFDHG